jgi:uncharacterized hydrophobic protein (TIGR00271 family)
MLHLRMISPPASTDRVVEALGANASVCNIVVLAAAARRPEGDLVLCDVAREDASVVLADLRDLGLHHEGSIVVQSIETQLSDRMARATRAARGTPADAVVWEEVTNRTEESAELSGSFAMFMVLAALIAAVGLFLDSSILIVGAMVVGPEFGPIAGLCVAMLTRRSDVARRSARALVVGFALAIVGVVVASWIFRATGATPDSFDAHDHELARIISRPDFFAFFVAFCAGIVGMLSLTTAKSSTLIGVFISITTIPSAANAGIGAAYGDWSTFGGALAQLAINLSAILVAGMLTLLVQRSLYERRRREHLAAVGDGGARHDRYEPPRDDGGAVATRAAASASEAQRP